MNQNSLKKILDGLPLGNVRYFESIGSTNDEALARATSDAPDLTLIVADEQTAGRGRLDRKWFTPPGSALAFSLILRPTADEKPHLSRTVGLAALAVANALRTRGIHAQIKWPNDILINDRKVAGILVESVWSGEEAERVVIGIGINVTKDALPPDDMLHFPAISLEEVTGETIDREILLRDILLEIIALRPRLNTDSFILSWQASLAYMGQRVQITTDNDQPHAAGEIIGLESDGSLRLRNEHGETVTVRFGDVRLRSLA